jgi:hypothetical protein
LSCAEAIKYGVAVGEMQIAYNQFHSRHAYPICGVNSFI